MAGRPASLSTPPPTKGFPRYLLAPAPKEGEQLILLPSFHKTNEDYRYTTMRDNLMNAGYPKQWTPRKLIPLPYTPPCPTAS